MKKLKRRRRYPYLVQVPEGKVIAKDGKSRTKYKYIGYVSTREELLYKIQVIFMKKFEKFKILNFWLEM